MILSLGISAFAANTENLSFDSLTPEEQETFIQNEITKREEIAFMEVYEQLKEQNAISHMPIYKEYISSMIEAEVRKAYNSDISPQAATVSYYLPNGGVVGYVSTLGSTTVLSTYLNHQDTLDYLAHSDGSFIKIVTSFATGLIKGWGPAFSALFALDALADYMGRQSVHRAGDYAIIMKVRDIAGTQSISTIGWSAYPYANVPSDATNINIASKP